MAVTPTTQAAKAPYELKDLIANSAWFQSWVGAVDAAAAKGRIVIGEVFRSDAPSKPFVAILSKEARVRFPAGGRAGVPGGTLEVVARAETSAAYQSDGENATLEAVEAAGKLAEEIGSGASATGWLADNRVTISELRFRDIGADGSVKKFVEWSALLDVEWGAA